jgi:hypothetical protein
MDTDEHDVILHKYRETSYITDELFSVQHYNNNKSKYALLWDIKLIFKCYRSETNPIIPIMTLIIDKIKNLKRELYFVRLDMFGNGYLVHSLDSSAETVCLNRLH